MAELTVDLNAPAGVTGQPILWRLGKIFNVVTSIQRVRVSEDCAYIQLHLEGSKQELDMALAYLRSLGVVSGSKPVSTPAGTVYPEDEIKQSNTIDIRLKTVFPTQGNTPVLYRLGKDYHVVVNVRHAAFDEEEGGYVDITVAGDLIDVQRAITYLHTTGLSVNPKQRSVTNGGNL